MINCFRHPSHCLMDQHWKPFIAECSYCEIPYAVIARTETFEEDQKFIGQLAGVNFKKTVANAGRGVNSTKDAVKIYFEQLNRQTVEELFKFYQMDFEMFGYSQEL